MTLSVAQQIVPFAAELAEPRLCGATIGTVMSGLLCGILFGRALGGVVGDHYGWRAMFWPGLLLAVAVGLLLAAVFWRCNSPPDTVSAPKSPACSGSSERSAYSLRLLPGRSQTGEVLIPSLDLAALSCSRPGCLLKCGARSQA